MSIFSSELPGHELKLLENYVDEKGKRVLVVECECGGYKRRATSSYGMRGAKKPVNNEYRKHLREVNESGQARTDSASDPPRAELGSGD